MASSIHTNDYGALWGSIFIKRVENVCRGFIFTLYNFDCIFFLWKYSKKFFWKLHKSTAGKLCTFHNVNLIQVESVNIEIKKHWL